MKSSSQKNGMRIQLITSNFPPMVGGMETHVFQLAKNLSKKHEVEVLWFTDEDETPHSGRFSVHKIPLYEYSKYTIPNLLFRARNLSQHIKRFKPDLLHSHNIGHNISIFLTNTDTPTVFTNHSSKFLNEFYQGKTRDMLKFRLSFDFVDYCITPSEELQKTTQQVTDTPVIEIPNGVDTQRFHPDSERKNIDKFGEEDFVVLTTRRFEKKNGMWFLARAIPKTNEEVKFVLLGNGSERDEIQEWIERNDEDDRVYMPGAVPNDQIHEYYNRADVSILPSLKEAVSISALESMASGTPLIGTEVGGLPEIITDHENGLLVAPKDSEAIAEAINELYDSTVLVEEMGDAARKTVEKNYSWDQISKRTTKVYREVL